MQLSSSAAMSQLPKSPPPPRPPSGFDVIDEECMSPTSACEEGETADSPQSTVGDYVTILC